MNARPMRSSESVPGRFSRREMVDCDARIRAGRQHAFRQLEGWIGPQGRGVVAVLVAAGNHQYPEPDQGGEAMNDLVLRPWIADAGRQPFRNAQALLDLPQHQDARVR